MNDNAKKWVAALRSGEYKQTHFALHVPEDYTPSPEEHGGHGDLVPGFCCLGVACVLYQDEVGDLRVVTNPHEPVMYDGDQGGLPTRVTEWLGMHNGIGLLKGGAESLPDKNDDDKLTFPEIADWIEAHPELFDPVPFEDNATA